MSQIVVTDIQGNSGSIIIDACDFYHTISQWFDLKKFPAFKIALRDIESIVPSSIWSNDLEGYANFLGLKINRVS